MSDTTEQWIGVIAVFILGFFCGGKLVMTFRVDCMQDEAVQRGYAEYVIKDKQALWQWKDTK